MGGGMNKRGSFGSMAERVARSAGPRPAADAAPAAGPADGDPREPPPIKHCWVTDRHGRMPALLLGWRRRAGGFHGRVVHAVLDDDGWAVVEEWLPAELLEPLDHRPGGRPAG